MENDGKGGACWRGRGSKITYRAEPAGGRVAGRGLVLRAGPGGQGFTCGSHLLVPANHAHARTHSLSCGSLDGSKRSSCPSSAVGVPEQGELPDPSRHLPDAQKELSFLSLGSLMVSHEQLHRINILRFEPLRVDRVILAGPVSSALNAEKPWLAPLTLNSRLCHTPSQMGRAGKRSLQINSIEALLDSWAYIQSFL